MNKHFCYHGETLGSWFLTGASTPPLKSMMHIAFPPIPKKIIIPLYFSKFINFPRIFVQLKFILLNLRYFASPYFDRDAFMYHALHVFYVFHVYVYWFAMPPWFLDCLKVLLLQFCGIRIPVNIDQGFDSCHVSLPAVFHRDFLSF